MMSVSAMILLMIVVSSVIMPAVFLMPAFLVISSSGTDLMFFDACNERCEQGIHDIGKE